MKGPILVGNNLAVPAELAMTAGVTTRHLAPMANTVVPREARLEGGFSDSSLLLSARITGQNTVFSTG